MSTKEFMRLVNAEMKQEYCTDMEVLAGVYGMSFRLWHDEGSMDIEVIGGDLTIYEVDGQFEVDKIREVQEAVGSVYRSYSYEIDEYLREAM